MREDINDYVDSCLICQKNKASRKSSKYPIQPLSVPSRPWATVAVDFIVKLPKSNGFDSILVVVDHFSKMSHFIPCKETITAKETAVLFLVNVFRIHGFPERIISDRGPQFKSKFWSSLFLLAGVKPKLTSSFHPQSNGQTERTNQTLEQYLRCFVNFEQDNWSDLLPFAEFAFNNSLSSATGTTPFYANFGFHPRSDFLHFSVTPENPSSHDLLKNIKEIQDKLYNELLKSKDNMIKNQGPVNPASFSINDLVWLKSTNISSPRPCPKLDHKKIGPFRVLKKLSPVSYELEIPASLNVHPIFHISLLEKCTSRKDEKIPLVTKDLRYEDEFLVKSVLGVKMINNEFFYLIRWKNDDSESNTWEPLKNLTNCLPLVRAYHKRFPDQPRPQENLLFKRRIVLKKH